MNLTINTKNGMTLLVAEGTILENDLQNISKEIEKLPATQDVYILLDCVGLKKVIYSSLGFSGLIDKFLEFKSKNTKIILFGHDSLTFRLLQLLKMDHLFKYSHSLDEAYLILNKFPKEVSHLNLRNAQ